MQANAAAQATGAVIATVILIEIFVSLSLACRDFAIDFGFYCCACGCDYGFDFDRVVCARDCVIWIGGLHERWKKRELQR